MNEADTYKVDSALLQQHTNNQANPGGEPLFPGSEGRPAIQTATPSNQAERTGLLEMADINDNNPSHAENTNYQDEYKSQNRGQSFVSSTFKSKLIRRRTEILLVALFAVIIALATFFGVVFGARANATTSNGPTVGVSYGQFQGVSLPSGVTQFLGVRYAAPAQRFMAPQPPQPFQGVHIADTVTPGCRGSGTFTTDTEDCLFADIYAPTGAGPSSKLPVYVFIQGGGLTNALAHLNGTNIIQAANKNLITVGFSYRAGVFGFLASEEVQRGGALNIGFLDQYRLLEWVQKEISQFGGDPNHVVIGGQSAGAGSVVSQLAAYGGVNKGLFHGAIMESSSMPPVRNVSDQQFQYDNIVQNAGCQGETDTLACLKSKSGQDILNAAKSAPYPGANGSPVFQWSPVIDDSFIQDLPIASFANGSFVHVPIVFGDDTDEGTVFTPRSIKTEAQARGFIKNNWPTVTSDQLDEISSTYDFNDTAPTGEYWERAAEAYGEIRYICPGIHMSNLASDQPDMSGKVWNWRYNVATSSQIARGFGVSHGSELMAIFGPGGSTSSQAELLASSNGTHNVVNHVQAYWISFLQTLDPNTRKSSTAPEWTSWNGTNRILFNLNGTTMEDIDSDQLDRCGYLAQITLDLKQ